MSQRDRSGRDRGDEGEPRRDPRDVDRTSGSPVRRPRQSSFDDESTELPSWSNQSSRGGVRDQTERGSAASSHGSVPPRESTSSGRREPIPQLGDAFRRPGRSRAFDPDDQSPASTRDPYDRLRRVASRPARPVAFDDELETEGGFAGGYDDEEFQPAPRPRTRRRAVGPPPDRTYRPPASQQLGGLIAAAAPQTRFIAAVAGISIVSLVFMAATVAGRRSSLPDWMPIHLNAEGNPDFWGNPDTLWRIPIMVAMLTIMSGAVAWFAGKSDPFAARFAVGSVIIVHALSWIALVRLAW